jgi:hypothetical protein
MFSLCIYNDATFNSLRHEVRVFKPGSKNEPLNTVCLENGQSFKDETNFKLYSFFRQMW